MMKLEPAKKSKDYTMRLLKGCKSLGGPCLSINVLSMILNKYSDKEKITVITEIAHFAHSHKIGKLAQPELFCLNRIDVNEQLENLAILQEKMRIMHQQV